jgi:hypothetical protein
MLDRQRQYVYVPTMSNQLRNPEQHPASELWAPFEKAPLIADAQEKLLTQGLVIVSDSANKHGFDPLFRPYALATYFNPDVGILKPETYDVFPHNRLRARGVVGFEFSPDGQSVRLWDHQENRLHRTEYHPDERQYEITPLMEDPLMEDYLRNILQLIPRPVTSENSDGPWGSYFQLNEFHNFMLTGRPTVASNHLIGPMIMGWADSFDEYMQEFFRIARAGCRGKIGVNFFEVFTDVVSGYHHDEVDYAVVDRLDRRGGGTVTELRPLGAKRSALTIGALEPGQKVIFDDRLRAHKTGKLEKLNGGGCFARSIVSTVDYESPLSDRVLDSMLEAAYELTNINQLNIPWIDEVMQVASMLTNPEIDHREFFQEYRERKLARKTMTLT